MTSDATTRQSAAPRMRICYFVSEYPAVPHTFIRREIRELERSRIDVFRVSLRRNARELVDPVDLEERDRTRYVFEAGFVELGSAFVVALIRRPKGLFRATASMSRMMRRSHRPRVYHLAYLAEALIVAKWALERGVDHIHAHFGTNGAEVAQLAHLLSGVPYSFTVHGPDEFDRPEYLGLGEKVKHSAFVRAISSFTRSQLCRWVAPADWPKIRVVRCGLDADFTARPPRSGIADRKLVTVGRLSEQKGHLVLLDALAVVARRGMPFEMTIVGDGPLRPTLERRIRELGLDDRVEITGWQTSAQVHARISAARAIVMPSFAEGLPVALMEAMALGRPVVTTYVAGIPELVTDGKCGWVVPAGDVDRLADAVERCLRAPGTLIRAMGEVGRKRVLERHDIARECRKLANLFQQHQGSKLSEVVAAFDEGGSIGEIESARSAGPAASATKTTIAAVLTP